MALFHRAAGQGDLLVQAADMDRAGALHAVVVAAGGIILLRPHLVLTDIATIRS